MVERVLFGNLSAVILISLSYHLRRPLGWHPANRFSASSTPYLLPSSSLRNSWVEGLEKVEHLGPSLISTTTLSRSQGDIPEVFLRQAGLDNTLITFVQSLVSQPTPYFTCLLSYSDQDQALAQRLSADLQSQNVLCWSISHLVNMHDDIHPETDHIRVYDKLILLLSKHSIQSWWARMEAATASLMEARRNRPMLITLKLDHAMKPVSPPWVDEMFRTHCFYNFTRWKDPTDYQQAFITLLDALQPEDQSAN